MSEEENRLPERCICGGADFRPVTVWQSPQKPLYRTEFMACTSCGVMYHPIRFRSLLKGGAAPPHKPELPRFRHDVDTSDWKPPPGKVWTEDP